MTNDLSTEQRDILELLDAASGTALEYHELRAALSWRGRPIVSLNAFGELTRRKLIEYQLERQATGALGRYQLTYEGREAARRRSA